MEWQNEGNEDNNTWNSLWMKLKFPRGLRRNNKGNNRFYRILEHYKSKLKTVAGDWTIK